jgi:hypothetical protein
MTTDNSDLIGKVIVIGGTKLDGKEAEAIYAKIATIEEDGTLTAVIVNDDPRLRWRMRTGLDRDEVRESIARLSKHRQ